MSNTPDPEDLNDQQIDEMFADLKPEDFFRETSAIDSTPLKQPMSGPAAFVAFVDAMIEGVRKQFDSRSPEEPWEPLAALQGPTERRFYGPDEDETNMMFMSRLRREALDMGATWFFTCMAGHVGMWTDINDLEENPNKQIIALMWYAECRESDFQIVRQGVITINDATIEDMNLGGVVVLGGTAGINYEGDPAGAADIFKAVLNQKVI